MGPACLFDIIYHNKVLCYFLKKVENVRDSLKLKLSLKIKLWIFYNTFLKIKEREKQIILIFFC